MNPHASSPDTPGDDQAHAATVDGWLVPPDNPPQGVADFQKIVSSGLTPELLRWKGIEATEKLAMGSNAKVVVIGAGKDGLPLILGGP